MLPISMCHITPTCSKNESTRALWRLIKLGSGGGGSKLGRMLTRLEGGSLEACGLLGEEATSMPHSSAAKPCTKRSKPAREPGAESAAMYMKSYTQLFFFSTYTKYCFFTPSSAALISVRSASRPSKLTLVCELCARSVNCKNKC